MEMLIPLPQLKEAIGKWVAAKRRGDSAAAATLQATAEAMKEALESKRGAGWWG